MPFTNTNDYTQGRAQPVTPAAGGNATMRYSQVVPAGDLALNVIGHIGFLPAGCVPVEIRVDGTAGIGGAGAGVFSVGILNDAGTALSTATADGGGVWGTTGTAVAAAFDKTLTRTLNNMANVQASSVDRRIGILVSTGVTTPAAGTISLTLIVRSV